MASSQGLSNFSMACIRFLVARLALDWSNMRFMDLSNLDSFRKQIAEAQTSIQKLYTFRKVIDGKIADLRNLVRANANFLPDKEREAELLVLEMLRIPENITEAVRIAVFLACAHKEGVTPIEIKEEAEQRGFDFSEYSNPMASIHTILKRMKDADPPEVKYDEQNGTYTYCEDIPFEAADYSVYHHLNQVAWFKFVNSDQERSKAIALETVKEYLESVNKRIKRPKALKEAAE